MPAGQEVPKGREWIECSGCYFDPSDLVLIHMANLGVVNACRDAAPDAWRRVVALLIQSFEAPARGPLPASPEHHALYKAMLRSSPTNGM
ncbi:hypothetical protein [Streptomyces sp. 3214.6]|uniref:hypothetical protein n=1 Tax=Streptomyces sp. 3214.6 TaxID=1882757 RepID=UPI001E34D506|nr:hypothetical protein [Streptomyces sp. 3214.6]